MQLQSSSMYHQFNHEVTIHVNILKSRITIYIFEPHNLDLGQTCTKPKPNLHLCTSYPFMMFNDHTSKNSQVFYQA